MCLVSFLCLMVAHSNSVFSESGRVECAVDRHLVSTIRFNYFGRCTAQQTEVYHPAPFMRIEYLKIEEVRKELDLTPSQEARMQKLIGKEREAMAKKDDEKNGTLDERMKNYVVACTEIEEELGDVLIEFQAKQFQDFLAWYKLRRLGVLGFAKDAGMTAEELNRLKLWLSERQVEVKPAIDRLAEKLANEIIETFNENQREQMERELLKHGPPPLEFLGLDFQACSRLDEKDKVRGSIDLFEFLPFYEVRLDGSWRKHSRSGRPMPVNAVDVCRHLVFEEFEQHAGFAVPNRILERLKLVMNDVEEEVRNMDPSLPREEGRLLRNKCFENARKRLDAILVDGDDAKEIREFLISAQATANGMCTILVSSDAFQQRYRVDEGQVSKLKQIGTRGFEVVKNELLLQEKSMVEKLAKEFPVFQSFALKYQPIESMPSFLVAYFGVE